MFRELCLSVERKRDAIETMSNMDINDDGSIVSRAPRKSFAQAESQIVVADVSMSLDNVLAVAGAAREHPAILIVGLALSVGLMGIAAGYIARLLHRHRWRLRRTASDRVCRPREVPRNGRTLALHNPFMTSRV
jgi:predicted tellurium resistance membrane protein TerC